MRTKIVRRYVSPRYPTHDYLLQHPELLRWVPQRWRGNRLVLGVLSLVVPLILARPAMGADAKDVSPGTVRVAPIFNHGDGRGSFGCLVINPPVFLSEDEARQVVQDEAKKAGIEFTADGLTLKDAMVPVTNEYDFIEEMEDGKSGDSKEKDRRKSPELQKQDIVLDGYDKKRKIAYEVVTKKDFEEWEKNYSVIGSSVSDYNFKATVESLSKGLPQSKGEAIIGIFYEPGASSPEIEWPGKDASEADWKNHRKERNKAAKELGEKQLRRQVRDFLKWLKAEGVI